MLFLPLNQIMVAGTYAAVAEAIAFGQSLSLPMDRVISSLQNGAASSWPLKNRSDAMLSDYYPLGFKLELHKKDLDIALKTASELGLELPITSLIRTIEEDLCKMGHGDKDISVLRRYTDRSHYKTSN